MLGASNVTNSRRPSTFVTGRDILDRRRHAVGRNRSIRERREQSVARRRGFAGDLGAEHQGAPDGDLGHVHQVDVVALERVQRAKELRAHAVAVRSAHRDEVRRA